MTTRPSGLSKSDANLARNLFGASPAEIIRPVSSNTRSLMALPSAFGPLYMVDIPLTSRKASSIDRGSM